jgi:hypothetical protein
VDDLRFYGRELTAEIGPIGDPLSDSHDPFRTGGKRRNGSAKLRDCFLSYDAPEPLRSYVS